MDNISDMLAGENIDMLIAERVMGWRWIEYDSEINLHQPARHKKLIAPNDHAHIGCCSSDGDLPAYSVDMAAAWMVLEKLHNDYGFNIDIYLEVGFDPMCDIHPPALEGWSIRAGTVPLAICHAALTAIY
jgi:hypothetical protein